MTVAPPPPLALPSAEVAALRAAVAGPVLTPEDPGFAEETAAFNVATVHRPAVAVGATSARDVAAAVGWAAQRGLAVAVQSTGHGAETSVDGGVLVTTRRLRDVEVDPDTCRARLGAGARWSDVVSAAAPHGLSPLSGSSPDVGAVGYVLGGGLPILGRTFGFGADLVRSFEVVTADGVLRHVDADSEPDLFWALRGGRGAFAAVTALTVELLPLADLYGGTILYPGEHAEVVLHAWRTWVHGLGEETSSSIALMRFPDAPFIPEPLRGRMVVALRVAHLGDDESGAAAVAPMRAVAPVLEDAVGRIPYTAAASIHRDPTDPGPGYHRGSLLSDLPGEAVDALLAVAGPGAQVPLVMVELRHLGGAMARAPRVPDAVPARDGAFLLMTLGALVPPVADAVPLAARVVQSALEPWTRPGCPLTFLGAADPEEVASVWPVEVHARLRQVKAAYDPGDLFRHGHRILPAGGVPAERVSLPAQAPHSE